MVCASEVGLRLIRKFEGRRLSAYQDAAGIWTIGYGHTGPRAQPGASISAAQANQLLAQDAETAAQSVTALISAPLTQGMADALISLVFNIGASAFARSSARRYLNAGQIADAAAAMTWWNKATINGKKTTLKGLVRRRCAEVELFLSDSPPA